LLRVKIKIKARRPDLIPAYMSEGASGFDVKADLEAPMIIEPGRIALIPTGLSFEIPEGFEIQIRPRSGLALKGITVLNSPGTVDSDYRGEVKVILANLSDEPFTVEPGMRIAQGVLVRVYRAEFVEAEPTPTDRGAGGFGSTGVK